MSFEKIEHLSTEYCDVYLAFGFGVGHQGMKCASCSQIIRTKVCYEVLPTNDMWPDVVCKNIECVNIAKIKLRLLQ